MFLRFVNYYRRFIHKYFKLTAPLTDLLKDSEKSKKSGPFIWEKESEQAFRTLCDKFTSASILHHFDPAKKIKLETDASGFGIAGILSQPDEEGHSRPVAFWSRKMIPAEMNYETHDQELLAIVAMFQQWRHYLEGAAHAVEVWSDHNNLRGFMKQKELNSRQARWALKLAAYDFEIFHRPGKTNPADGPSRRPDYEGASPLNTKLLPTLQNKLALSAREQTDPGDLGSASDIAAGIQLTEEDNARAANRREVLEGLDPLFQLAGVQVVIPRKEVRDIPEEPYEEPQRSMKSLIKELQASDKTVKEFVEKSKESPRRRRNKSYWEMDPEGLLRFKDRLYVPGDAAVREELISKHHDDPLAGHFGADKTMDLIQRKFYWPACAEQVRSYVKTCDICQRTKVHRHKPFGELKSLPVSDTPWKEITMDFITGLPSSKRRGAVYDSILVVVDRCTKMARYIPVTTKIDAATLAEVFYEEILLRFGTPTGIVSDRGSVFTSAFWSSVCYHARIKRRLSTAFHPQTDGLTERQNQVLETYLRTFADAEQAEWANMLPMAEFAYNNATHSSTGASPYYLMYGYHPEIHYVVEDDPTGEKVPSAKDRVKHLHDVREALVKRLEHAAAEQAKYYNQKHTPKEFNVGDLVMLNTKNLKQRRPSKKMSHKYVGPFRVEDKVGAQAYRLTLPNTYRIHNTFHVSLLEDYHHREGDKHAEQLMQAPELIDDEEQWEIEEILGRTGGRKGIWYKVKWLNWGSEYNQWLHEDEFMNAPELVEEYNERAPRKRRRWH